MVNEQIKKEIKKQVEEQFKDIKKSLEIFNLPLISQYKLLLWNGQANGINMIPNFPIADIQGKFIVIKSIRVVPYYNGGGIDITLDDGATVANEVVWNGSRIDRLFDDYANGAYFNLSINNIILPLFTNVGISGFPLDINLDNIFYKFPAAIQNIDFQINARVINDLTTGALVVPLVKAYIECYLI